MRVNGQPVFAPSFKHRRDSTASLKPGTVRGATFGRPRAGKPDPFVAVNAVVQIGGHEGKGADRAPDVPPLIVFERIQTDNEGSPSPKRNHIVREDGATPFVVVGTYAVLHLVEPRLDDTLKVDS